MKLLVFDTCLNKTYIVLRDNEKIIANKIIESTDENYHSAYLIPQITAILKEYKLKIQDLDAIGVNIGPGSFTGIRVCITIARVMAQQAGIKLIGVPSSQILSKINTTNSNTLIVTDARKNKVYLSMYNSIGEPVIEPRLEDKDKIKQYVDNQIFVISDKSIGEYLESEGIKAFIYDNNDNDFGLYLSDICYDALMKNDSDYNWAKVKPLYIQSPSITKPKETNFV